MAPAEWWTKPSNFQSGSIHIGKGALRCAPRSRRQPRLPRRGVRSIRTDSRIVINITDGEATDGDLVAEARKLTAVSGEDGSVLLFNIHLSSTAGPSIELPGNGNKLPDKHARQLFEASSTLTPFMVARATELGMPAEENSRGFIFNAQPLHVIHFLDIGTRPANVHLR